MRRKLPRQLTAEEILEKARRDALPSTPAERRKIEAAGQILMPGHDQLPTLKLGQKADRSTP